MTDIATRRAALVEKVARAMEAYDSFAYEYQLTSSWEHLAEAALTVALEEAAKVAEGDGVEAAGDEYQSDKPGHFWDRESIYGQGRSEAAAAIRALIPGGGK